jgi:hypothetical protein
MIKAQSDMINFCFQVLAIFLKFCDSSNYAFYDGLYGSIIRAENWTEDNISLVSSYLQYISIYLTINPKKLTEDREKFEQILTKLIEIDHYELFYRLLKWILKITNLEAFY